MHNCNKCGKEMPKRNIFFETYYDVDGKHWSVDFDFSIKAKKAGFKIFVDPEAEMGHVGDPPVIGKKEYLKHIENIYNLQNQTKTINSLK